MKPISLSVKRAILKDDFYKACCRCGADTVEWHHALQYGGSQLNEKFAIVPACHACHLAVDTTPDAKDYFKFVAISRMPGDKKMRYERYNWNQEKKRIIEHYPDFQIKYNLYVKS